MTGDAPWEIVSFVLSSELRTRVLQALSSQQSTPSQIAKHVDQPISHVSRALKELHERGLVVLLTPHRTKARLYEITPEGRAVLDKVAALRGK